MIFEPNDTFTDTGSGEARSSYQLLPGIGVLFGGMWITNLYYWGNNQYIIQRALAATSLREAQKGVAFAAFLKLFIPLFAVLPGIAAFVLVADIDKADQAFPWVLSKLVGIGFKGLTFAALVAAIGSSISSMVNSASTIFTLDIYKRLIKPTASEARQVTVGKISAAVALVVGALIGPMLGSLGQVFQFIQEYTGYISPGVFTIFLFGMFWRRATANAGLAVVAASIPFSLLLNILQPELPFLDRMGIVFVLCCLLLVVISLVDGKARAREIAITVPTGSTNEKEGDHVITPAADARQDRRQRIGLVIALLATSFATGLKIVLQDIPGVAKLAGVGTIVLVLILIYLLLTDRRADNEKAIIMRPELFHTSPLFNISAFMITLILTAVYTLLG